MNEPLATSHADKMLLMQPQAPYYLLPPWHSMLRPPCQLQQFLQHSARNTERLIASCKAAWHHPATRRTACAYNSYAAT